MHEVVVMTVRKAVSAASMGRRGQQPLASGIIPSHDVEAGELGQECNYLVERNSRNASRSDYG